ncbi:MAG: hypothetical protein HY810_01715 [Candidatus Omnitrophica bacterium]|nr:hypothetical protein [Candidatus Omnitrophota bacterium]
MKIAVLLIIFIAISILISMCLYAEEIGQSIISSQIQPKINPLAEGLTGTISLDLRRIDIHDALKYFSLKSGLNIVTTKAVDGRVSLVVEDVPVKDVFDIMLRSNGLAYDKVGDIYNVMTQEEYVTLYGQRFADVREVKIFRLDYAVPEHVFNVLDAFKSDVGRILVNPDTGSVLCMDSPDKISQMEQMIKEFEKEDITKVFTLNYAKAKVVEEQLMSRLDGKKVGSIKADERANQVIVQAFAHRMKEVEKLIEALDKKTKEVLIDTKIVKIKLVDGTQTGVEWEGLFNVSEKSGLAYVGSYPFSSVSGSTDEWVSRQQAYDNAGYVGSYPFSGTTTNFSASSAIMGLNKLHLGIIGHNDFDVLLTYLKTENKAKILSNPKIAVTDNQEARIHVGERQAYVTTTTTSGQSTSTVAEQVSFIDVGIQMDVIPTINEDGFVNLKLKAEVSSVVNVLITPTENKIPIVDTSLAETAVLVKDGATVVIGGLRKEENTEQSSRVPIFSKIPLLGKLFQKSHGSKDVTELLIMITPTIISGEALVMEEGKEIGEANIKPIQKYDELERIKKEQQTYMPPAPEEAFGGMQLKGFRVYNKP